MNRATRVGALIGALAISTLCAGTAEAASTVSGRAQTAAVGQEESGFFTPGPDALFMKNADAGTHSSAKDAVTTNGIFPSVKHVKHLGQSCGTKLIQHTSGLGKTTLVMSVEKSVATTVSTEAKIDATYISIGMGWDVTRSYTVKDETRFEVPKGKFGYVQAFPLYEHYRGTAYDQFDIPRGEVHAYKPVGVCFSEYAK
ncbi:hypothetical protein ACFWIY_34350 [Streptomyces sioyaensis]|uniref:hypothetical protein n=1 Tax=Streptomyces sioyaensis TaxID=67364 RepID=UPI003654FFE8